jgi:choline dehydrogenase-like flavoprotein
MNSPTFSESTTFTRDVEGRYVCNTLDEAKASMDTAQRPDAKPFDIVIVGGGTFGAALAAALLERDRERKHRILVLEGGPFAVHEHVQNIPLAGFTGPDPIHLATIQQWQANNDIQAFRNWNREVWGLAWHSPHKFPGLAYCVGGRSLFWGGWSPQLLDAEMPANRWPAAVKTDLNDTYFRQASEQIGVTETNDFIQGELHEALRKRLFDGVNGNKITGAIPLAELDLHLDDVPAAKMDLHKLEAPLAVKTRDRSGAFPPNKFSAVPLLVKAARAAAIESQGDDVKKRLMVVPNCHVTRIATTPTGGNPALRVATVETNLGPVSVPANGVVIVALGTIESTRLAKNSFDRPHIGSNLMAHLRSNYTIRIPRGSLGIPVAVKDLQASALFLKGRHQHTDGTLSHFHLQITASGLDKPAGGSEAELFMKVPDLDTMNTLRKADDQFIVITMRGIGEMEPRNPNNFVALDSQADEFGLPRAIVQLAPSAKDNALWATMDKAADDVAKLFADGGTMVVVENKRDGLGTTHHETGTLWIGTDPNDSVTNADCRFHHVANAYVAGPALFPTIGSPNPMLTGIAFARRLARQVVPDIADATAEAGFTPMFNGHGLKGWTMAGAGGFRVVDAALESFNDTSELGLLWSHVPTPADYTLRLEWRVFRPQDNSGVFLRFPDPDSKGYINPAWVAVHFGFEVQIDELGQPDSAAIHQTGAIYNEPGQTLTLQPAKAPGQWNEYEIRVQGDSYTVFLNGAQVTQFNNPHAGRGLASTAQAPSYFGLQTYPGQHVQFRNIRIKSGVAAAASASSTFAAPRRRTTLTVPTGKSP